MRIARPMALVALVASVAGCIDPLLGPQPDGDDPLENFDLLWTEFDRNYSFFELKGIDWAALRETYRPRIRSTTTETRLLLVVSDMLDELEDGHVTVITDDDTYRYTGWYDGYPRSYLPSLVLTRLGDSHARAPGGLLEYGEPEPGVGYVRIPRFVPGMAGDLDLALDTLGPLSALIIDVRHNGGGSDSEVREMAGRLVAERRLYRTVQYRNGPEHDDFTPPIPSFVEPRGPHQFTGPIALLTNRRTFSAAESFVLAVRTREGVTVVGDTTGGGSGNPMARELPNGWTYRLSRWIAYDPAGRPFEGVGLPPDLYMTFELGSVVDPILEEAIRVLTEAAGA